MALQTGSHLGQYEIIEQLGAGGMGEVYRARDTRLGRDVAIKVVLEAFLADRDRLVRFEREARTLAALNHPNVATLYGMEEAGGQHFLVMEMVEGPTLAGKLATPITLDHCIAIARQIAEGLEAAHEKGIVHRDLKPANVKITPDDKVKVLDFGLATVTPSERGATAVSVANSPTVTAIETQAGMILGTASYMSPEQARGSATDHRSDIFSFGVVLYEMLTGRRPFQGDTVSDVLASVLTREPDLSSLPPDLAPRLLELVRRCLEKQPRRRWQAIGDVRYELEAIASNPRGADNAATVASVAAALLQPKPLWRRALPIAVTAIAAAGITAVALGFTRRAPAPGPVSRFAVPFTQGQERTTSSGPNLAISPDGLRFAYVASRQIQLRDVGGFDSRTLSATLSLGIGVPFNLAFSPQGTAVAYYENVDQTIKQIPVTGGVPSTVCRINEVSNGLSWYGDFVYLSTPKGIQRCAVGGGEPELIIRIKADDAVTRPQVLADGRLLFSLSEATIGGRDRWTDAAVVVQRPGESAPTVIFKGGNDPRYLPSGHLVYVSAGILYARTFDPARLTVGTAVPIVEGIYRTSGSVGGGLWWYAVSDTGTLVYQPGAVGASGAQKTLATFDRAGKADALEIPPGLYSTPRLSPDGARLAFGANDGRDVSIWMFEMTGAGSARRLTFGGHDRDPVWSADGKNVIFQSDREGDLALYAQPADGSGTAVRLTKPATSVSHIAECASPDGAVLLFDETKDNRTSLMVYSFKDKTSSAFADITSALATGATFSPNGRWVAYAIRGETPSLSTVFVQPYPATGAKYQLSRSGEDGHHPVWSRDGKALFYTPAPDRLTEIAVNSSAGALSYGPGSPFARPFASAPPSSERTFDITRNAKGEPIIIGILTNRTDESRPENRVVLNWFDELRTKVK